MVTEVYTYREFAWEQICEVVREAVGTTEGLSDGFAAVLCGLRDDFDAAIDCVSTLAKAMNQEVEGGPPQRRYGPAGRGRPFNALERDR